MEDILYLYNKEVDQLQMTSTKSMVYIPKEIVNKMEQEHGEDLERSYGRLALNENDELIYQDYITTLLVHKTMYYFTETPADTVVGEQDPFYLTQVKRKDFITNDLLRQDSRNGTRIVLFYDNDFHVIEIPEGYKFDYEKKKVVKDVEKEINNILYRVDQNTFENDVKYNGFPFEINGVTYLQPFRGNEDRGYYSSMKNDISPDEREIKFFKDNGTGVRDSSNYDLVKGPSLSDLFLAGMIMKMIKYENAVKPVVEAYIEEIYKAVDKKDLNLLTSLFENRQKNIINRIEKEINS